MPPWMPSVVRITLALFVLLSLVIWLGQRRILFPAPPASAQTGAPERPGLQVLWLGEESPTEAWLLLPDVPAPRHPAVLFAHGNGEIIDMWEGAFRGLQAQGVAVLLVEYPGYGRSPGRPSEASIADTMVRAYDRLAAHPDIQADAIVGYGRSMGGGAIHQLAARRELAGLVLESTFTSVADIAATMGLPRWLVRDPFDSLPVLRDFAGPVLIFHGRHDPVVPFSHGEALHRAAKRSSFVPMDCGHNDCPSTWRQVLAFLEEEGLGPAAVGGEEGAPPVDPG